MRIAAGEEPLGLRPAASTKNKAAELEMAGETRAPAAFNKRKKPLFTPTENHPTGERDRRERSNQYRAGHTRM